MYSHELIIHRGEEMIFIKEKNGIVEYMHYKPFHEKHGLKKTVAELEQEGFLVDFIPTPEQIENKTPVLHINTETKELWYEYIEDEVM